MEMDVTLSEAEYRRIFADAYVRPLPEIAGEGHNRRDTIFRRQVRKAIEEKRKRKLADVTPHDCKRERKTVKRFGEHVTIEVRT